jgi:hypothetical protein
MSRWPADLRRLSAAAVCALATYAQAYRTFSPADGAQSYFGWYEPVADGLSAVALAALAVLLVAEWPRAQCALRRHCR